ncbi:unnamed protein product [Phytophthora lilii]|uniref:Unnamed protein product n=1 Tax=Phytophthora lilii TaxID=2077276 RepID=A0A9W6X2X7_9STRA|nr:unnamed protein product [Phytophthora lilii]
MAARRLAMLKPETSLQSVRRLQRGAAAARQSASTADRLPRAARRHHFSRGGRSSELNGLVLEFSCAICCISVDAKSVNPVITASVSKGLCAVPCHADVARVRGEPIQATSCLTFAFACTFHPLSYVFSQHSGIQPPS